MKQTVFYKEKIDQMRFYKANLSDITSQKRFFLMFAVEYSSVSIC